MHRWLLLLVWMESVALFAAEETPPPLPTPFELQGRIGAQYNINNTVRSIYDAWTPVYQLEASSGTWNHLYGWFNAGFTTQSGKTATFNTSTTYFLIPLATGLKYAFFVSNTTFWYLGLGANLSYLHTHDKSPYVPERTVKWDWGCTAKSGLRYTPPSRHYFLEFFIDYSYLPFHFSSEPTLERPSIEMGGLIIGVGAGLPVVK